MLHYYYSLSGYLSPKGIVEDAIVDLLWKMLVAWLLC